MSLPEHDSSRLEPGDASVRVVSAAPGPFARIARLWRYRELLVGLVRTELKVKYKNSILGFLWSMLNPALYLVVFWIVFTKFLPSGIAPFPIYLMSGLLVWNLFSTGLGGATGSVVANGGIVKKVSFPREILPVASVGAALVHFFLQSIVLVLALAVFRYSVGWGYLWLLIPALLTLLVFTVALGILLSATNVYLRDTQHLLELVLLAWFWMTPIIYAVRTVLDKGGIVAAVYRLNPVMWIVLAFQRAIYNRVDSVTNAGKTVTHILPADAGSSFYLWHLGVVFAGSCILLIVALTVFGRLEGNFAEEL